MRASAYRIDPQSYTHNVRIRDHQLTVDEPGSAGGDDAGPSPQELLAASLATCAAITIEMYAKRKHWELGEVDVDVCYEPAARGSATRFALSIELSGDCTEEQRERLLAIASRCPVHRILEGEVVFDSRISQLPDADTRTSTDLPAPSAAIAPAKRR